MRYCPQCQQQWVGRFKFCPEDGAPLYDSIPDPLIGKILNDRFEIVSRIGSGPLGVVYKSKHLLLEELRAIKVLSPETLENKENPAKLRKAISRAEALHSENTVRLFDLDRFESQYMIVEEFVDGDSLSSLIRSKEKLPYEQAVQILRQVCASLEEAHGLGVCHFNLKPNNILLSRDGNESSAGSVKVSDYGTGLIKEYKPLAWSQSDRASGVALYWAPEQIKGDALGQKADVFALGLVAYQMLTGELPDVMADSNQLLDDRDWSRKLKDLLQGHQIEESVQELVVQMLRLNTDHRPTIAGVAGIIKSLSSDETTKRMDEEIKTTDAVEVKAPQTVSAKIQPGVEAPKEVERPAEVPMIQREEAPFLTSEFSSTRPAPNVYHDKGTAEESTGGYSVAASTEKPLRALRWLKYTWLLPLLMLLPIGLSMLRSRSSTIEELLSAWELGPEFILMFILMCTAMLILVYAYWLLKTKDNKSTNLRARKPTSAQSRPVSQTWALPQRSTKPREPKQPEPERPRAESRPAPLPEVFQISDWKVEAPFVSDQDKAGIRPAPTMSLAEEVQATSATEPEPVVVPDKMDATPNQSPLFSYLKPAVQKDKKWTWREWIALLKPDFKGPKTQASLFHYVKPAGQADEKWTWRERLALLKPDLKGPKTQASLFHYVKPAEQADEKWTWRERLALLKPDFKEPKTQASLFHYIKEEGAEGEGNEVELSPEIAQLLAERAKSRAPNLISSLFADASEVDQTVVKFRRRRALIGMLSIAFHVVVIVLLVTLLLIKPHQEIKKPEQVTFLVAPPPPKPMIFQTKVNQDGGGGGGGGRREIIPPSRGRLPKTTKEVQLVPPDPKPQPMTSKDTLIAEQSVVVPIDLPQDKALPIGDITAPPDKTTASSGPGSGSGIGTGRGSGIGSGRGPGVGPGSGGGIGGGEGGGVGSGHGPYVAGMSGVRDPDLIESPQPHYTEEARRSKIEGIVRLQVVIRRNGKVDNVRVVKGLGYGLDESAAHTVATRWRFRPGTLNGQPVDVLVNIEITFRML